MQQIKPAYQNYTLALFVTENSYFISDNRNGHLAYFLYGVHGENIFIGVQQTFQDVE
jgi:hypothetical protein